MKSIDDRTRAEIAEVDGMVFVPPSFDIDPAVADLAITVPLTWATEQRKLSDLVDQPDNPRKLSNHDRTEIRNSLAKFAQVTSLVVNTDNQLIGGHQRKQVLSAMAEYGSNTLVDVRVPSRTLTAEEVNELNIRLNRNTGEWDWDVLAESFDQMDLTDWGFTEEEFGGGADKIDWAKALGDLPDGDREPFQQMTFTLHDTQVEQVKAALTASKALGEFVDSKNENSNGNALARICETFVTEHGQS